MPLQYVGAMKLTTNLLTTTVIGSWPKPSWLSGGRHDSSGWSIDPDWRFQGEALRKKQDEATEWALREQESTGVDIVSDGEQRRDNYVHYHCRQLHGFDFEQRTRIARRSGTWEFGGPTITGPVTSRQIFLTADYNFVRKRTGRRIKMTIPGPLTIIDSARDAYYGDEAALAFDLARAIRVEVEALAAAGCDIIQFDEPCFVRNPQKVFDYGLQAVEACFLGVSGINTVIHMCCGYPVEGYPKASADGYSLLAPILANSNIDQVSIEGAHRPFDPQVLRKFGEKQVEFGLLDVGESRVETVEQIELRIKQVLEHIEPDRLFLGPDCGMIHLSPEFAKAKLTNLVGAARRVRESL